MKKLFAAFRRKIIRKTATQQDLIEFVKNKDNLKRAAEGSMQKRIDLIDRVELIQKNA